MADLEDLSLGEVLERLYKAEINAGIASFWDAGYRVWIGDESNGIEREAQFSVGKGGAISQAAEVVILLHRKAYYAERKAPHLRSDADWDAMKSRDALAIVDKARGGQRAQVPFLMDMPTAAVWPA